MKRFLIGCGLFAFGLSVILPLAWVVWTSLKASPEIFESPWGFPRHPDWHNYVTAWTDGGIGVGFVNSFLVTVGTLAILIPIGAMAAYVFARYPFRGSQALFGTFLGGMMFPQFLTIVPLFFLMQQLGLYDTRIGLTCVYVAFSLPFTVFVLRGFFETLPKELDEAAMMDGCGHARAFWQVMLPLAKPGLIVVAIFNAIGLWNEYSLALVLISSDQNMTLPLGVAHLAITNQYQGDWGGLFAALVIVMTPVLALYWAFRERIHEVMLAGALKG